MVNGVRTCALPLSDPRESAPPCPGRGGADSRGSGSSADEAPQVAQIIRDSDAQHAEADAQRHLTTPHGPQRETAAEDDAGRDEDAMKRNHLGTGTREFGVRVRR